MSDHTDADGFSAAGPLDEPLHNTLSWDGDRLTDPQNDDAWIESTVTVDPQEVR